MLHFRQRHASPWPIIALMMFWAGFIFVLWLGRATLLLLPVLVAGFGAFFVLRALMRESFRAARDLPPTGELPYGFAGHTLHAFVDAGGRTWLRARDVRHLLGLTRTDAWMSQRYPDGWRRAHAGSRAWFVTPDTVRRHWGGSGRPEVNRFLSWLDRELVPLSASRAAAADAAAQAAPPQAPASRNAVIDYCVRHWRGELGLASLAISGAFLLAITLHLYSLEPEAAEVARHYRRYAALLLAELLGGTLLAAWWGVGAWRTARRWLAADRSLLVGLGVAMAGMTLLMSAFAHLASVDRDLTIFTFARMAADLDPKPTVSVDGTRLRMVGEMGYGTTNRVRATLAANPAVREIELDSLGGSAMEGFALAELVRDRGLDTFVSRECASACVLVFAGGTERRVAPAARFGLHRSGVAWKQGDGVNATDVAMAKWFAERGVARPFIERILATPFEEMWWLSVGEVVGSGLAMGEV